MLDMGFVDEITEMLGKLPKNRQSLFFSATMPPKIKNLVSTFQNNPITVDVVVGETTDNVDQDIVRVYDRTEKYRKLETILKGEEFSRVLIFSETKRDVERLATDLVKSGFKAESIHGDKRQSQRQRALDMFKKSHVDILVATDVAARGIDIKGVTHVINYTAPKNYDDYVHRIGRTGRAGKTGVALTFVGA
jgi:superfamily II DNA/RNA helicase